MADLKILEPVLLASLAKQGIAAGNVELRRDYAPRSRGQGYSPYARCYCDIVSGKNFAVISGLPMCDAYGQAHELVWRDNNGIIENGNNIFHSVIDKGAVRLVSLSDQPNGIKKDDELACHPQLFIGGVEILPFSDTPKLLETDPANENYHNNILEWDYGVCKRRIRLIEGRFLGSWVFSTNPKGDVLIKYNQSGKLKLRLQYAGDDDTEFIPRAFFDGAKEYPVTISDSATFYPDANPETASVDGFCYHEVGAGASWATLVGGAGTGAEDSGASYRAVGYDTDDETDKFRVIFRGIFLFDTSSLPDSAAISAAILSLYGNYKGGTYPDVNIYSSAPASNTALASGDFDSLGATAFCDTPITYAGWSDAGYNNFALNASGIAAISKTGVSKFGSRDASHDVANSAPPWVSVAWPRLVCYYAEQGTGYQPRLVVTYTEGTTAKSASETGSGAEAKISGNPVVITGGAEIGSGSESLGSRAQAQSETGAGLESLESRCMGKTEAGSGLDMASLLAAVSRYETGAGVEAGLKIAAFISGETGLGLELSWMQKDALSGDAGGGYDALNALVKTADSSSEMRLSGRAGQAGMQSKQVRMPSKGVNL